MRQKTQTCMVDEKLIAEVLARKPKCMKCKALLPHNSLYCVECGRTMAKPIVLPEFESITASLASEHEILRKDVN